MRFENRTAAGQALARRLATFGPDCVIAALARGGTPVGYEVARHLGAPLMVIPVRKLSSPFQPEFTLGAVAPAGVIEFNEPAIFGLEIAPDQLVEIVETGRAALEERAAAYAPFQPDVLLENKPVIIVDDGLATGMTMLAASRFVLQQLPRIVNAAAPVCSREAVAQLKREEIETVCLQQPESFISVGQWYEDFSQVSDVDVISLLKDADKHQQQHQTASPPG